MIAQIARRLSCVAQMTSRIPRERVFIRPGPTRSPLGHSPAPRDRTAGERREEEGAKRRTCWTLVDSMKQIYIQVSSWALRCNSISKDPFQQPGRIFSETLLALVYFPIILSEKPHTHGYTCQAHPTLIVTPALTLDTYPFSQGLCGVCRGPCDVRRRLCGLQCAARL